MLRFQRYGSAIAHFSVLVFGTAACASPPSAIGTGGTSSSAGSAGMAGNTSVGGSAGTSGASGGSMGGGAGTHGENGGSGGGAIGGAGNGSLGGSAGTNAGSGGSGGGAGNGSLGGSAGANAGSAGSAGAGGSSAEAGSSGVGGSGGTGNPDLDDLLLEGVGDIDRPPPYEYGPYAQRRDDVPHGTVHEFTYEEDTFYPEAGPRGIKVFEPAQYEVGEEVFLAVFHDGTASWAYLNDDSHGGTYRTLNVLDNLMAEELIPPFIGVFIGNEGDGGNRQAELGPVDDKNVRFILEGVLPAVSERYGYNFSTDPRKRSITGESSGGNAAFTAAWERPDAFHRMMGHSSSFSFGPAANLPEIVRMTEEVKPLRIHLEGGMMDGRHHAEMAAALAEKGYVYQWFNSTGSGHGGPGGDTSFPEGLIWLWKGWEYL
jgi:enterochelin esterase-like enzyme